MKLARTTEVTCDSCTAVEVVRDGDVIQRYAPSGAVIGVRVIGEKTPATKADLVNAVIARGWAALVPDKVDGHTRITGKGAHILIIRSGMLLACGDCAVKSDPAASRLDAASRIRSALRDLNDILERLAG